MESSLDESENKVDLVINASDNGFSTEESENVSPESSFPTSANENVNVTINIDYKSTATETSPKIEAKKRTISPIRFPKGYKSIENHESLEVDSGHSVKRSKMAKGPTFVKVSSEFDSHQLNLFDHLKSDENTETEEETVVELDSLNFSPEMRDLLSLDHIHQSLPEDEVLNDATIQNFLVSKLDVSDFFVFFNCDHCKPALNENSGTVIHKNEEIFIETLAVRELTESCNDGSFYNCQLLEHWPTMSDNGSSEEVSFPNSAEHITKRLGKKRDVIDSTEEEYAEAETVGSDWDLQSLPDSGNASDSVFDSESVFERLGKKQHGILETDEIGPEWDVPSLELPQTKHQNSLAGSADDLENNGSVFARLGDRHLPESPDIHPEHLSLGSVDAIATLQNDGGSESKLAKHLGLPMHILGKEENKLTVFDPNSHGLPPSHEVHSAIPVVAEPEPAMRGPESFITEDPAEDQDNNDPEWQHLCLLNSDDERYKAVRARWKNLTIPNPNQDLTCKNYNKRHVRLDVNANFCNVNPRKRQLAEPVQEQKAKRFRTRANTCTTALFETKIGNIELEFANKRKMLDWDYRKRMQGVEERYSSILQSGGPYYQRPMMLEEMHREMREITRKYHDKVNNACGQCNKKVAKLRDSEEEILAVQRFYSGLKNSSNDVDASALNPLQWQPIELVWDRHKLMYESEPAFLACGKHEADLVIDGERYSCQTFAIVGTTFEVNLFLQEENLKENNKLGQRNRSGTDSWQSSALSPLQVDVSWSPASFSPAGEMKSMLYGGMDLSNYGLAASKKSVDIYEELVASKDREIEQLRQEIKQLKLVVVEMEATANMSQSHSKVEASQAQEMSEELNELQKEKKNLELETESMVYRIKENEEARESLEWEVQQLRERLSNNDPSEVMQLLVEMRSLREELRMACHKNRELIAEVLKLRDENTKLVKEALVKLVQRDAKLNDSIYFSDDPESGSTQYKELPVTLELSRSLPVLGSPDHIQLPQRSVSLGPSQFSPPSTDSVITDELLSLGTPTKGVQTDITALHGSPTRYHAHYRTASYRDPVLGNRVSKQALNRKKSSIIESKMAGSRPPIARPPQVEDNSSDTDELLQEAEQFILKTMGKDMGMFNQVITGAGSTVNHSLIEGNCQQSSNIHCSPIKFEATRTVKSCRPFIPKCALDIHVGHTVRYHGHNGRITQGKVAFVGQIPEQTGVFVGIDDDVSSFQSCEAPRRTFIQFKKVILAWDHLSRL